MSKDTRIEALQTLIAEMAPAVQHFRNSRDEFTLGLTAVLDAIQRADAEDNPLHGYVHSVAPFLNAAKTLLEIALKQWQVDAPVGPQAGPQLQAGLIEVREFLARYLLRLDPNDETGQRKGLIAVLAILDQEIENRSNAPVAESPPHKNPEDNEVAARTSADKETQDNITWIEVEG